VLSTTFWYGCTFIGDQVAVQRYLTTSSVQAAVKGNIVNFVGDFVVMILLALCGMALLTYYLDPAFQTDIAEGISDPRNAKVADRVFPHFIEYGLPPGMSGLVVAALFAVAMSSLDSGINSVAAVLTIDVFERLRPDRSGDRQLSLPRRITFVVGVAATALALLMLLIPDHYNIIGITARTFNCALGPLAAMFVAGMFVRRVGQTAIVTATWLGLAFAISLAWWVELVWLLGLTEFGTLAEATNNTSGPSPFLITPLASTFTFVSAVLLSLVFPNKASDESSDFLWWSVVNRKELSIENGNSGD
jgi:SSS family solute:Na+ symporter